MGTRSFIASTSSGDILMTDNNAKFQSHRFTLTSMSAALMPVLTDLTSDHQNRGNRNDRTNENLRTDNRGMMRLVVTPPVTPMQGDKLKKRRRSNRVSHFESSD